MRRVLCALVAVTCVDGSAQAEGCKMGILADLPVTMEGSRASVPVKINGKDTRLWLDSGAFFSMMSQAKAAEFGLRTEAMPPWFRVSGINGSASAELTRIKSFGIVGQELKNLEFLVGGSDPGNGLIGRNILGMADTEFDLADGSVKLIDPHGCDHTLMTYWAPNKPYFTAPLLPGTNSMDHLFKLPVFINGAKIEAEFDTGSPSSLLSRTAALRAGIDLSGPEVVPTSIGGIGRHYMKGWVVPMAKIAIGDEQILNSHINVIDDRSDNHAIPEMLLGEDYIMAHHIYVARRQQRIYFTYTGGKPFSTARETPQPSVATAAKPIPFTLPPGTHLAEAVGNNAGDPKTAEGFARRGASRQSVHDLPGALADLTEAIRQSPDTAEYYADRAGAYEMSGNMAAASSDLDHALLLNPDNGQALLGRAELRLAAKDRPGALADAKAAARIIPPPSLENIPLAGLFDQLGQPAQAIPLLTAIIVAHPDDVHLDEMLNERCWARALADVALDKALADCNRAIRHDATRPAWRDSRALVYYRKRDYPAAIAEYDAVLQMAPDKALALYMRGASRIALGEADKGKADQSAAQAIRPNIAEIVAELGITQ